ncbi:hypothetical protein FRC17_008196 [Serendipita sp. 399]|nr:hypothetical protein FRC17_008196 [Serendipita sp. 399]
MNQQPQMGWQVPVIQTATGWVATVGINPGALVLREAPLVTLPRPYDNNQLSLALGQLNVQLAAAYRQLPAPRVGPNQDKTIFEYFALKFGDQLGVFAVASQLSRSFGPNLSRHWTGQFLEIRASRRIQANQELLSAPFSIRALLQPHVGCVRSSDWHSIQPKPQCESCVTVSNEESAVIRAKLAEILLGQGSPKPPIQRLLSAIQWVNAEHLECFKNDLLYRLYLEYKDQGDRSNAMLYLREAILQTEHLIGTEDIRVQHLHNELATL